MIVRVYLGMLTHDGRPIDEEAAHGVFGTWFEGYTSWKGEGAFRGVREPTLVFESVCPTASMTRAIAAATALAIACEQWTVGLCTWEASGDLQLVRGQVPAPKEYGLE